MRAILKKENKVDFTHIGLGFMFIFIGGILRLIGKEFELIFIMRGGNILIVYGFLGWILLEMLLGDADDMKHPLTGVVE